MKKAITKRSKKVILFFVLLAIICGIGWSVYYKIKVANFLHNQHSIPIPEVTITKAITQDVALTFEYPGRVAGFKEVEIRSQASGILLKLNYSEGQFIKMGETLFQIDPAPFEANLQKVKARLDSDIAALWQSDQNLKRVLILFNKNGVSQQERDDAIASYEEAKAKVKQSEAELVNAKIDLTYTKVLAPITGITSEKKYSEGNLITKNELMTNMVQLDRVYINFAYPDDDFYIQKNLSTLDSSVDVHTQIDKNINTINKISKTTNSKITKITQDDVILNAKSNSKQLQAIVKFGDNFSNTKTGIVDFTSSTIDTNTMTVFARAEVDNSDHTLIPGQFVRIQVNGFTKKNVIVIPDIAIIQSPNGAVVYCLDSEDKIIVKPVVLSNHVSDGYIIEKGIDEGDRVVIGGMIKAHPGTKVTISSPNK